MRIFNSNIKTYITFNKGGSWQRLTPPSTDSNNKRIKCSPDNDCYLNIYIYRETTVPFHSHENAHGIILANGNTGEYLVDNAYKTNMYLSRDGGFTWIEIAKGHHVYDMADHGGLILKSALMENTNVDKAITTYSWNEGEEW